MGNSNKINNNFITFFKTSPVNSFISSVNIFSPPTFLNSIKIIKKSRRFSNLFLLLIYLLLSKMLLGFFIKITIFSKSFDKCLKTKLNLWNKPFNNSTFSKRNPLRFLII